MLEFSGKEFQRASIKLLSWATMHIIETNEKLKDSERRYKKGTEIPEQNNIQNKKDLIYGLSCRTEGNQKNSVKMKI